MIEIGKMAPFFCLPNQDEIEVCIRDLAGKWVILYFYPKDNTPGCTTEACDFTVAMPKFERLNATILGVSPDSPKLHQKFIEKYNLNFTLLSDFNKDVAKLYDVLKLKKLYGREYIGIERSTFIIEPNGKIAFVFRGVKVKGHIEEIENKLIELQK